MSRLARAAGAMLLAVLPAPLSAQEAPADPMATAQTSAADQVAAARQPAAAPAAEAACKPKKKKGFGLGSILKAASKSGLTGMVGGGVLGGYGGAVANAAISTGVGVAESSKANSKPAADGC